MITSLYFDNSVAITAKTFCTPPYEKMESHKKTIFIMSLFCLPHKMLFDYSSQSICLYDGNVQICAAILFMISNGKSNNKK